ncbi:MAG: AIPR family protein [Neptuniibacter sp.]
MKNILQDRFVPSLPPLLGNQSPEANSDKQISRAFNAFVLQKKFDLSANVAASMIVDDFADNGIDAIYYHEADETLYILQGKLKATEGFVQGDAESFTRGIRLLVEQDLETFNQLVQDKAQYLENALDHCSRIKLIVAYTGNTVTQTAINVLEQLAGDNTLDEERITEDICYINSEEIEGFLRSEQSIGLVNTRIKLSHSSKIEQPRKTVIGLAKLDDLVRLHDQHQKALYQKNIRYFIGSGRRGVNQAITETLENSPENFLHLNNGITVVCTGIDPKRSQGGYKDYVVAGFSVVNGAQTISTAAEFKQKNPDADTSAAKVQLTLIVASANGDFHKQVTRARNLQNPISLSDFAALDDNQERLRQEIALFGIDYHYRPQQKSQLGSPIIEIDTLAKALAVLDRDVRYPALLKSEPSQFTSMQSDAYKKIFSDDLSGCKCINAVTVLRVIQDLLSTADRSSPSPEKIVYRHCGYSLANILIKRFKDRIEGADLLTEERVRELISVPFDELRQIFADQYQLVGLGSAPHAFFKRISDTSKMTQKAAIEYQNLNDDQAVTALLSRMQADDPYNQRLSNYLADRAQQI